MLVNFSDSDSSARTWRGWQRESRFAPVRRRGETQALTSLPCVFEHAPRQEQRAGPLREKAPGAPAQTGTPSDRTRATTSITRAPRHPMHSKSPQRPGHAKSGPPTLKAVHRLRWNLAHRAFGHRGDREARVHAEVRRDDRAVDDVEILVAEDAGDSCRRPCRCRSLVPIGQPPRMCAVEALSSTTSTMPLCASPPIFFATRRATSFAIGRYTGAFGPLPGAESSFCENGHHQRRRSTQRRWLSSGCMTSRISVRTAKPKGTRRRNAVRG